MGLFDDFFRLACEAALLGCWFSVSQEHLLQLLEFTVRESNPTLDTKGEVFLRSFLKHPARQCRIS